MAKEEKKKASNFASLLGEMDESTSPAESPEKTVAKKKPEKAVKEIREEAPEKKKSQPKKKFSESVKKEPEVSDLEAKFLFEHGIDMKYGVTGEIDFDKWVKLVGSKWTNGSVNDGAKQLRISDENMKFLKVIAETTDISMTQGLNNILAFMRYRHKDYVKKLSKQREMDV